MPNLRDIKKRITSVRSTRQITRTMEMVAAAKVRRSVERVTEATPYSSAMGEMLTSLTAHTIGLEHPLLVRREDQRRCVCIVVTSDRGLAGGFNVNALREAERYMREKQAEGIDTDIIACGKKAIAYLKYRKVEPVMSFTDLSADPTVDEARRIAKYVIARYTAAEIDEVVVVYNHVRTVVDQDLRREQVLPIDTSDFAAPASDEEEAGAPLAAAYEYEPSAEEVLARLLPAYVLTAVYHALIDSAAGEQGARRKAMQAATESADDMISTLQRSYNRARQGAITTELNEIVAGAAALED